MAGRLKTIGSTHTGYVRVGRKVWSLAYMYMCMLPIAISHLGWVVRVPVGRRKL